MTLTRPLTRPLTRSITRGLTQAGAGGGAANTEATIVILLGQSLNSPRGTLVDATSWTSAQMFVDGSALNQFTFSSLNVTFPANWASFASTINYDEGPNQGTGVGILSTLEAGPRPAASLCSVAIPARSLSILNNSGPLANAQAAIMRFCELARAAGYTPKLVFYIAHGESDAGIATSEQAYYEGIISYFNFMRVVAMQSMGDAAYVAPIVFTYPCTMGNSVGNQGEDNRNIAEALRRVGQDMPGVIDGGPIYQWPIENDRVHPTPLGYILRGEHIGRILAGNTYEALRVTNVTLSGNTFIATFSHNIVRDATLGVGALLNAANAEDGLEWLDNGTFISISGLVYSGNTITGTLATTPVGSLAQQTFRVASQYTGSALAVWPGNDAGSYIRADEAGWVSPCDPTYTNYRWAIPQRFTGVTA